MGQATVRKDTADAQALSDYRTKIWAPTSRPSAV